MKREELENLFYFNPEKEKYFMDDNNQKWKDILFNKGFKIDDYYYEWCYNALNQIANNFTGDEDITENDVEIFDFSIEANCYTSNLTSWLNSDCNRVYYLTEALEEFETKDGFQALAIAQEKEMYEVFELLRSALMEYISNNQ